jgi:hypothetical protein
MSKTLNIPITVQGSGGIPFTPTRPRRHSVQLQVFENVTMSSESHNGSDGTELELEITKMSKFRGPGVV